MKKVSSKGLYIADPHFTDKEIPNRKDIFLDAVSLKFQESLEIARDKNLDYVVILGDLFHTADPGAARNRVIEILLRGNNSKNWPFEIFLVAGNHDLYGKNMQAIDKTSIKTLETVGLVKICDYSEKYGIYFGHYKVGIEQEKVDVNFPILAMHSYILPNSFYGSYVLIDDFFTNDSNKAVISGHYHAGYDIIEKKPGLYFANPGSLGRISATDATSHEIKVVMVELNKGEIDNIEYIPVGGACPAEQVFNLKAIEQNKKNKIDITEFINSIEIAKTTISKDADIVSSIKQFGEEIKMEQNVINEAIKRVLSAVDKEDEEDG